MLYRRFVIVASLIALVIGVGMANLVRYTKEHRNISRHYPGLIVSLAPVQPSLSRQIRFRS